MALAPPMPAKEMFEGVELLRALIQNIVEPSSELTSSATAFGSVTVQ